MAESGVCGNTISNNKTASTPEQIQYACVVAPSRPPRQDFTDQFCNFPNVVKPYEFDTTTVPFRVPFDFLANNYLYNADDPNQIFPFLNKNCNLLNGTFPGCTQNGTCEWAYETLGYADINNLWRDCGVPATKLNALFQCPSGAPRCCNYDAVYCQRTAFDETYKEACFRGTLESEFGLSLTWIVDNFWLHSTTSLVDFSAGSFMNHPITSKSFNPYQIYCDPSWCAGNPSADATNFLDCQFSQTTVSGEIRHAALVGGQCAEWYSNSSDYIYGRHNWTLIDTMIENYCRATSYSIDSFSCACVGGQPGFPSNPLRNYYTSCSQYGFTCDVAPVVATTGNPPQILESPLCANIDCIRGMAGEVFATRNIRQQFASCPTQSCFLINLGTTFSGNDITSSSVYIAGTSQLCTDKSISATAPDYTVRNFPTVWFWTNVGKSVTNPAQTALFNLTNVSPVVQMNYSVTHDTLPSWLTYQGAPLSGTIDSGASVEFQLTQNATSAPLSGSIFFTVSSLKPGGTFSSKIVPLNVAVIPIDKLQPLPPSPGSDTNPNDIPLLVNTQLSPGGISLILLALLFLAMTVFLFYYGAKIQSISFSNI